MIDISPKSKGQLNRRDNRAKADDYNVLSPYSQRTFSNIKSDVVKIRSNLVNITAPNTGDYVARIYLNTAQSLTNSTTTTLLLDRIGYDPRKMFAASKNGFIIPENGYYRLYGRITYSTSGTSGRRSLIIKTAAATLIQAEVVSSGVVSLNASDIVLLSKGDLITMTGFQTTGGSLALTTGITTSLSIEKVHTMQIQEELKNLKTVVQYLIQEVDKLKSNGGM